MWKEELLSVSVLSAWYHHIHRWRVVQADKEQTMTKSFGLPVVSHDSLHSVTCQVTCQWSEWLRESETDRWLRQMVIFTGEGAVESFIESFAVLLVPFNSGLYHLREGRDFGKWEGEMRRTENENWSVISAFRDSTMEKCVMCPSGSVSELIKAVFPFPAEWGTKGL